VALAYVVGFVVLLGTLGWEPHERVRSSVEPGAIVANADTRALPDYAMPPKEDH
jgi:hypothetical protein